jgi:hypothetical protein
MTTTRRVLVLLLLVAAAVFGTGAAQAQFKESITAGLTFATGTVAAPTAGPGSLTCRATSATMALTWTPSTSARVTGYLVSVHFSDGYVQTVQKSAADTSWTQGINLYNVTAYAVQYSVTTQTDYGWTAESARTGWFQC